MTATDELRRLLDERGVEWDALQEFEGGEMTRWRDSKGRYVTAYDDGVVTFFADFYWQPTPQQAIDATLGRGTCHVAYKHSEYPCSNDEICSECGASFYSIGEVNYCPNCGRRVVDE